MNSTFFYKISPLLTLGSFGVIKGHIPTQKRSSIDTLTRHQFVCELYNEIGGLKKTCKSAAYWYWNHETSTSSDFRKKTTKAGFQGQRSTSSRSRAINESWSTNPKVQVRTFSLIESSFWVPPNNLTKYFFFVCK